MNTENPPCAKWDMWTGPEVEGEVQKGVKTLFVRNCLSLPKLLRTIRKTEAKRVWLCDEYTRNTTTDAAAMVIECIYASFSLITVAAEVVCPDNQSSHKELARIQSLKNAGANVYVKFHWLALLSDGDHVCIGLPYRDKLFAVESVQRMDPAMYADDVEVKI